MPLAYSEVTTTGWVIYGFVGVVTVATVGFALYLTFRSAKQFKQLGADDPALVSSVEGTAQIVSSEWLGRVVNLEYVYRVALQVQLPGRAPYEATVEQGFDPMRAAALQPGNAVAVRVAADNPSYVRIGRA